MAIEWSMDQGRARQLSLSLLLSPLFLVRTSTKRPLQSALPILQCSRLLGVVGLWRQTASVSGLYLGNLRIKDFRNLFQLFDDRPRFLYRFHRLIQEMGSVRGQESVDNDFVR